MHYIVVTITSTYHNFVNMCIDLCIIKILHIKDIEMEIHSLLTGGAGATGG